MNLLLTLLLLALPARLPRAVAITIATRQSQPSATPYRGPNRLGPYRIDPNTPLTTLFRILGKPIHPSAGYFCYRSADGKAFLWFEARAHYPRLTGDLLLSTFPNCRGEPVEITRARIGSWQTGQGIGLGSTATAILRAYGSPGYRGSIQSNDPSITHIEPDGLPLATGVTLGQWIYTTTLDLRGAEFGLAHGRVAFISIGNNE